MANPHQFYRFYPAWNTGFYPQNQVASNQLNDIYVQLLAYVPSNFSGKTIDQYFSDIKSLVKPYNKFPIFGNFIVNIQKISDFPNWEYNINIVDRDLYLTDASQYVNINGFFNPTSKIVLNSSVGTFNVGAYSGTFGKSNIPVDQEVVNTLNIVNQYGSAIFPLTYKYDSSLGIATSGLARGNVYQLSDSGAINTIPATTLPSLNARRFTLPALTAEDKFAITFMERVINASIGQTDDVALAFEYNSIAMPEGMEKTFVLDSGTYDRIQINVTSANDRVFAMIGRLDGTWLWQRFVNDIGDDDNNDFLTTFSESTSLPYEPNSGSRYIYMDTWYDFDFCDFTPDCYVSPEFYPMPSIPGDIYQFNLPKESSNLTGLTSVNVGLFEQDGGFVQKIGTAEEQSYLCCNPYEMVYSNNIPEEGWDEILTQCNLYAISPATHKIGVVLLDPSHPELKREFWYDLETPFANKDELLNAFVSLTDTNNVFTKEVVGGINFILNYSPIGYDCTDNESFSCYIQLSEIPTFLIQGWEMTINGGYETNTINDFYASCTIPAVTDGCYRLGLYSETEESGWYLYSLSNIINIDRSDCFSTILEFWSDDNTIAQGFEYFNGWKQRVRIGLNGGGEKPVIEESLYRQSNGVHKRPQNKQDLSIDLHTDFFDLETQLAMTDATRHPYLVWNNQGIFVKGDIDVATIQDFTTQSSFETLSQMKFQALKQGFQPRNSSCLTC